MTRTRHLGRYAVGLAIAGLAACLALYGCNDAIYDYTGSDAPRYVPVSAANLKRPVVALVMGSGGRRGFAHVGVLKALEAGAIKPDLIVGVSVGSVIGALYANGMTAAQIETLAIELNLADVVDISFLAPGRVRGQALQDFVNDKVDNKMLEQLGMRFALVATRMSDQHLQLFNAGNTGVAVQASSAVPGRILPVRFGGETYVDGDVASPLPVRAARELGADVVIAVDISAYTENTPAEVPQQWRVQDRQRRAMIAAESGGADVIIHPDLGYYAGTSTEYRRRSIAIAAEATRAALPKIRAALDAKRAVSTTAAPTATSAAPAPPRPAAQ